REAAPRALWLPTARGSDANAARARTWPVAGPPRQEEGERQPPARKRPAQPAQVRLLPPRPSLLPRPPARARGAPNRAEARRPQPPPAPGRLPPRIPGSVPALRLEDRPARKTT